MSGWTAWNPKELMEATHPTPVINTNNSASIQRNMVVLQYICYVILLMPELLLESQLVATALLITSSV